VSEDEAALRLVQSLSGADPDALPFAWEEHYSAELAIPEVARLHQFFEGLDTYSWHQSGGASGGDGQWVYGDTGVPVMYRLLRRWGVGERDVFFDLGCGCGIPVFAASLLAGRAVGVDVVEPVVHFCQRAAAALESPNVEFYCQDLFATDISSATFIYLACTTFPPALRARLGEKMRQAKPGTKILSVTHPIQGKGIRHVLKVPQFFSWSGYGEGYNFEFHLHQRY
jgi:hypothetical protein